MSATSAGGGDGGRSRASDDGGAVVVAAAAPAADAAAAAQPAANTQPAALLLSGLMSSLLLPLPPSAGSSSGSDRGGGDGSGGSGAGGGSGAIGSGASASGVSGSGASGSGAAADHAGGGSGGDGGGGGGGGGAANQLVRLYVAGLPRSMTEPQLRTLFERVSFAVSCLMRVRLGMCACPRACCSPLTTCPSLLLTLPVRFSLPSLLCDAHISPHSQWGAVGDLSILRERASGSSRGCAFVCYADAPAAAAAIAALDGRAQLPGAPRCLEVRYARSRHFVPAGTGPEDNRQLFFSRAPLAATEGDVHALFSRFGAVEALSLFREGSGRASKGCGLVTMAARSEALAAMEALDEAYTMVRARCNRSLPARLPAAPLSHAALLASCFAV